MKRIAPVLAALAVTFGILASSGVAHATPIGTIIGPQANLSWGSPIYGTMTAAATYYDTSPDNSGHHGNDIIAAEQWTGANYGTYGPTWYYPTPGIHADELQTDVVLQYDDNGDGVADGNCWGHQYQYNAAGVYSVASGILNFSMADCLHKDVRIWERSWWDPGNFGVWQQHIEYGTGQFHLFTRNLYWCELYAC